MPIFVGLYVSALVVLVIFLLIYLYSLTVTQVPFLSLSKKHLPDILAALDLKPDSVFYELGCGDARILLAAAKANPSARCVGVEYALAPWLMATVTMWRIGKPDNVQIRKENFFDVDLTEATHVFCYLYPGVMRDLHQKFERELPPGAKVVSCDFEIPQKEPEKIIPFSNSKILGKKLFVYKY